MTTLHKPVLINEVLTYLNPRPHQWYIDATFGNGGHTRAILEAEPLCKVLALDWDKQAIDQYAPELQEKFGDRFKIAWANFAHLLRALKKENITHVDGILADFGTSQFQIFEKEGFSFRKNTPLDMRMSPAHQKKTAADIINHYSFNALVHILRDFGEERMAHALAKAFIAAREIKRFTTTEQLVAVIEQVKKPSYNKRTHVATQVFQALRIEVNQEFENMDCFLKAATQALRDTGKLVCISFHSLEDRIVKTFLKEQCEEFDITTPKPITASPEELALNPSSRSAKLRAAVKKGEKIDETY